MPPTDIKLTEDRRAVVIDWSLGATHQITAATLRSNCQSSRSRRDRIDGIAPTVPDNLTIVDIRPVGRYAVNVVFSDGHDRGIYPWSLLEDLANRGN